MQEESISTEDLVRKEVLPLTPLEEHRQCEVTMLREDKNRNGKSNPETHITGNKERNLSKKKSKLEKLQKTIEKTL
jgi:hypothetical protein